MGTIESPKARNTVLSNSQGQQRHVALAETGIEIGRGTRARVMEVLVDDQPMARKEFAVPASARRAMRGHSILENNLPKAELPLLVPMELDEAHNSVVIPKLNENAWVDSMGDNKSPDRTELSLKRKLFSIPNFNSAVERLMDAVQAYGDKGLTIGSDVYFLTIHRETHELGYVYADTEAMNIDPPGRCGSNAPLSNIYAAAGALNLFLHECVENPQAYLTRVRQEAIHRMNSYSLPDTYWQKELLAGEELRWPASSWKQQLSWLGVLLKRQVISAWHS